MDNAEDTARAVDLVIHSQLDKVGGECFNIGTGRQFSVIEIAKMVSSEFGIKEEFEFIPERFGQVQQHISSTQKAEKVIGFKSSISFEKGLEKTIQWYKDNRSLWEKQIPLRRVPVKRRDGSVIWY